jgi:hypothetical protein
MRQSGCTDAIRNRIDAAKSGSVFILSDFSDLAEPDAVRKAITRLENDGTLTRVMRGVYYKPEFNEMLDENVVPHPDDVAHALARNYGWTIAPCGDTAMNLLGLSEQVPSQWVYVSDGAYREYSYGNATLYFKRTAKKELSNMSPKSALIVQALKTCGKDGVTQKMIEKLRSVTTGDERKALLSETQYATSWIYETIKEICQ